MKRHSIIPNIASTPAWLMLLIISFVACWSCTEKEDLWDTISIYEEDGQLPIYSEWGYNTFGAYYERSTMESDPDRVPFKVLVDSTSTDLILSGSIHGIYNTGLKLRLSLHQFTPTGYKDFLLFHDSVLVLNNTDHSLRLQIGNDTDTLEIIEGVFHVKRVQDLRVDLTHQHLIFSGEFAFKALQSGTPITISDGRFDFSLGNYNFFKQQ